MLRAVKIVELIESGKNQGKWSEEYAKKQTTKLIPKTLDLDIEASSSKFSAG